MSTLWTWVGKLVGQRPTEVVLVVAAAARLPGLAGKPLWYDEAFAVLFSATGPRAMTYGTLAAEQGVAADVHPLGYYSLLWAWTGVFGDAIWVVRLLSALLGLVTVYLGMRFASDLLDERAGLMAGLLLAIAPFPVHYSQEVRMYALMALLLLSATWAFRRALDRGGVWRWSLFALLAALAQYTHTLSAFYLAALAASALGRRRWVEVRATLLAGLAALLLYFPWLLYVPSQISRLRWAYWVTQPGLAELIRTWLVFVAGLPVWQWTLGIGLFGTFLASAMAAFGSLRARQAADRSAGAGLWCLYLAVVPPALMFLFSYWQPVYLERALLASGIAFLIWLGWGLSRPQLPRIYRWTAIIGFLVAAAVGLAGSYAYRGFPYAPFADLTVQLNPPGARERVVHSNKITAIPMAYYDRQAEVHYLADPPGSASDTLAPATQQVLGLIADPDIATAAADATHLALVVFEQEIEDYRSLGFDGHPALQWLEREYRLASRDQYGDLLVFHYRR